MLVTDPRELVSAVVRVCVHGELIREPLAMSDAVPMPACPFAGVRNTVSIAEGVDVGAPRLSFLGYSCPRSNPAHRSHPLKAAISTTSAIACMSEYLKPSHFPVRSSYSCHSSSPTRELNRRSIR